MNKALFIAAICSLLIATSTPVVGQLENLNGERLDRWRIALDRAADRAASRTLERTQPAEEGDLGLQGSISLPDEKPLQRLVQSGWNVMDIAVTGTVMTTPASWFHDITEPEKYRRGQQVIDGWLSTTRKPVVSDAPTATSSENPLHRCAVYLNRALDYHQREVRDCTFLLYKRELISGRMQTQQQMFTRVRFAVDDQDIFVAEVFVEYRAPGSHEGRRIVYKKGQNDDKMLVRMGSGLVSQLTLKVSPQSRLAKMESQFLITDTGPVSAIRRLLTYIENTVRIDPRGEVTKVSYYKNSKVAGRSCLALVISFLEQREGLERAKAIVFVDSKTYVPIYVASFDWPTSPGGKPQLHEEFIYTDLQFNTGLKDEQFRLDAKP